MTFQNEYSGNIHKEACMNKRYRLGLLMVLLSFNSFLAFAVASADAPRMSKEELKNRLGDKDIVVIDVRTGYDWEKSDSKIRGAVREDPQHAASWAKKYTKEKTIVLYCA
jgi:predicted sulfurtransferase